MREMTAEELHRWYVDGVWPCGHGAQYIPGPRGGWMRNIQCPTCGMKMNVLDPESHYRDVPIGQVIYEPDGYERPTVGSYTPRRWQNHVLWPILAVCGALLSLVYLVNKGLSP